MQRQEKTRHLLRRFGLGASPKEVRSLEGLSMDDAIDRVLNFEGVQDAYSVSPWEFTTNSQNAQLNTNGRTMAVWWTLEMCVTSRPLQEKLALFWHDHFAVSDEKVQDGRKMLQYLQVLRKHASGNFAEMFMEVSKTPAMEVYLDTFQNVKGRPNENFAREVMELFTLGVDNGYTETDIQEAAKALTGWAFRDTIDYRNRQTSPVEDQIKAKVAAGQDTFEFAYFPNRHQEGPKTIFGQTGEFVGDDVVRLLLEKPETSRLVCSKLWDCFAYPDPEKEIVDRLVAVFTKNNFEIKPVLRAIATSPEFWSERSLRTKVKSPVDFTVALARQFGAVAVMEKRGVGEKDPFKPIVQEIAQFARVVDGQMRKQGLDLLYPPSVEGWHWGEEWINTESMLYRIDLARQLFGNRRLIEPMIDWTVPEIAVEPGPGADAQLTDRLLDLIDVRIGEEQRSALAGFASDLRLNDAMYGERGRVEKLSQFLKVVFALPQAHVC